MRLTYILLFLFVFQARCLALAQTDASQLQRSAELIQKEKELRAQIETRQRVFLKKIIIRGVTLLKEEELSQIISAYQRKWVYKDEIEQILSLVRQAYQAKGITSGKIIIDYQLKGSSLRINVTEKLNKPN